MLFFNRKFSMKVRKGRLQMKRKQRKSGIQIDQYAYRSGMLPWNPAWKAGCAVLTLLCCVAMNKISVSIFVILSMGILTVCCGKLPLKEYVRLFRIPAAFLLVGTFAVATGLSLEPSGDWSVHLKWFYLYSSELLVYRAAEIFAKALGAVSALYMMALSTPSGEWINLLARLHVPDMMIELMYLIYRFIFIIGDSEQKLRTAAQARNGYADWKTSMKTFGKIGGNLFVLSLQKARAYGVAMEARGCDGPILFLEEEKPMRIWQIGAAVAYFGILTLLWAM